MKIAGVNYSTSYRQPAFQAVNQKYLKWAEKNYKLVKNGATSEWVESLTDDVILFKDVSKRDAIDTMNAVRKFVDPDSMKAFESTLKVIKNS